MLSKLLKDTTIMGQMHGFQVVDNGIMISHLQFVDDTLIFMDADVEDIRRIFYYS